VPHTVHSSSAAPRRRRRGQSSRGTSLVEFALVGPILLLLVFGCIDFGRAYYHMNQLNNAAREGMRLAILQDHVCNTLDGPLSACTGSSSVSGETTVCQSILNEGDLISTSNWHCTEGGTLPASGTGTAGNAYVEIDEFAASSSSTVACDSSLSSSATTPRGSGNLSIEVKIDYYFRPITPIFGQLFPSSFHLEATSCGRAEF